MKNNKYFLVFLAIIVFIIFFSIKYGKEYSIWIEKNNVKSLQFHGIIIDKYYGSTTIEGIKDKPYYTLVVKTSCCIECIKLSRTNRNIFDILSIGDTVDKDKNALLFKINNKSTISYYDNIDSLKFIYQNNTCGKIFNREDRKGCQ